MVTLFGLQGQAMPPDLDKVQQAAWARDARFLDELLDTNQVGLVHRICRLQVSMWCARCTSDWCTLKMTDKGLIIQALDLHLTPEGSL